MNNDGLNYENDRNLEVIFSNTQFLKKTVEFLLLKLFVRM
jgi:hypothetical protein